MTPATVEQLRQLAAPLTPVDRGYGYAGEFTGTVAQASRCKALQGIALPGEPGGPKVSRTIYLPGGRKGAVSRSGRDRIYLVFWKTDAELDRESDWRRNREKVAKLHQRAVAEQAELAGQPATEQAFRLIATQAFWRIWSAFRHACLREQHASGFSYASSTVDVLDGFACSIAWALEADGTVMFDEGMRNRRVREALAEACKLDVPLQAMLDELRQAPAFAAEQVEVPEVVPRQ